MFVRISLIIMISSLVACSFEQQASPIKLPKDVWEEFRDPCDRLTALLPEGKYKADLLKLVAPKRLNDLAERFAKGLGESPLLLAKAMAQRVPGEPLPYDPAYGLTEEEWQEFLRMKDEMRLQSVGEIFVDIVKESTGTIAVKIRDPSGSEESLSLDPAAVAVTTAHGTFTDPHEALASAEQKVTGPWNSYEWTSGGSGFLTGKNVSLCLGQLEASKEALLIYRAKNIYTGEVYVDLAVRFSADGH